MFNTEIGPQTIRASSTLTALYVPATIVSMDTQNYVGLRVNYTKGDETSMELIVEVSPDGINYAQQVVETLAVSESTVTVHNYKFVTTDEYAIQIKNIRGKLLRISVKATGGTPTGTCDIIGFATWA